MEQIVEQIFQTHQTLLKLGAALLLGGLIGLQRGWEARERKEGERIAGIRTFALVGLLGGIAALLSQALSVWILPAILLGLVATMLMAFSHRLQKIHDFSITGLIGLILTFCFGATAVAVDLTIATAAAVVTAIILDNKQETHALLQKLKSRELDAGLKLLLITVVLLPLLPNTGMGPGGVLNPFTIWWMVVLIASISFVGYFAIRVAGAARGILFTSLFAGLSSSTALTLHFARMSRGSSSLSPLLAAGILIACGTMFPRILVYCLIVNRELLAYLIWPVIAMTLLLYLPAFWIWRQHRGNPTVEQPELLRNPLDLKAAVVFGVLLSAIMILGELLQTWLGNTGVYMLAATSGIVDVDAITLTLTRMAPGKIETHAAVTGIVIAAATNNLVKTGIAGVVGGKPLLLRVAGPMLLSLLAGLLVAFMVG